MSLILQWAAQTLGEADYSIVGAASDERAIVFEDDTVLGFVIEFDGFPDLLENWQERLSALTTAYVVALRRSREKAWNAYAILLCGDDVDSNQRSLLQAIEEDLSGTRKIARAGISDQQRLVRAILPLLPLQGAPELPLIDMEAEIRSRATELPEEALLAFFSDASESIALQVIEEAR